MPEITAIVFDLGGVLMDWDPCYLYDPFFDNDREASKHFLREIGFVEWNKEFDRGRPFAEGIAELKERFPKYWELIQAFDSRWAETLAGPIEPTVEILRDLKKTEYSLSALTNWSAEKFATIRHKYEFFSWFEVIVVSGEEKLVKPDTRIFQRLLAKIGRPARECLFIDDSATNIKAAAELGFETILFQSPEQLRLELTGRGIIRG